MDGMLARPAIEAARDWLGNPSPGGIHGRTLRAMPSCTSCAGSIPDGARFCPTCGARYDALHDSSPAREGARETRRVVTVLFADLVGSTGIAEQLDPEVFRTVQARMFTALRQTIEGHGGTVEKFIGDAVMAVFGLPTAHEDDALRAILAASQFGPALESLNRELTERHGLRLELRVGINTGEVVASEATDGGALVTGDAVHVAARLQQHAAPGEVLLGPTTLRLVQSSVSAEPVEDMNLRGRTDTVTAHRLRSVAPAGERPQRAATPLVARDRELAFLVDEFEQVQRTRACRMVTIVAPAGVGKSRLVREFQARTADRATTLRGRCLSYGEGITFWPMGQIIRRAIGQPDDAASDEIRAGLDAAVVGAPRAEVLASVLATLLGLGGTIGSHEEIGWAIRRFLAHVAQDGPLVVVVEDIHWAEPGLLDVLEAIVDWTRDAPILILCPSRPEVLDTRPTLIAGRDNASILRLAPLAAADTGTLIDALPGGAALPGALRRRIEEVAEGNPLFIEEMLGMLVDDGRLQREGDEWVAAPELDSLSVPVSVQALIAARIDALAAGERGVAERASVVGREFERSAVASLTATDEREPLAARLLSLTRKELIESTEPGLGGDDAFRFRHILIRDAAYERLPKRDRATLHARLADWLEGISGDGRADLLEIVGYHLAEAIRYRTEIGMDHDAVLVERALRALNEAATQAERGHRYADAAELLRRAVAILDDDAGRDDPHHDAEAMRVRAAEFAHLAGRPDVAASLAEAAIERLGERGERARAAAAQERLGTYLVEAGDPDRAMVVFQEALALEPEPSPGRARGLASLGRLLMLQDRHAEAKATLEEALRIPAMSGWESTRASAMTSLGSILNTAGAWDDGIGWIRHGLDLALSADDGFEIMRAYNNLGGALERAGEIDASIALFEAGLSELEKRRLSHLAPTMLANLSFNLLLAGRVAEAEARATQALEGGPASYAVSVIYDRLGWALLVAGRIDDAHDASRRAADWAERTRGGPNPQIVAFERQMGLGRVLAATEAFDAADAAFRDAVPDDAVGDLLSSLPDLAAEATGNRANQAARLREAGDLVGARAALASAEAWAEGLAERWPVDVEPSPRVRPSLAIIDAEVGRAAGRSDPDAWARVIDLAQPIELRLAEVYARFRYAEALATAEQPADEVSEAVHAALELSRQLGTDLYTVQIEALAARPA